jgi:hypothetical protein
MDMTRLAERGETVMKRNSSIVLLVAGLMAMPTLSAAGAEVPLSAVAAAAAERVVYGLRSDDAHVRAIISSGADVGSSQVGIVLTADELAELDLIGRAVIAERAATNVQPVAESLPGFAGMYQDQTRGGLVVIRFTSVSEDAQSKVANAAGAMPYVIESTAASTAAELREAALAAMARSKSILPGALVRQAQVDEIGNRVILGVAENDLRPARASEAAAAEALGVTVEVRVIEPIEQACDNALPNARFPCFDPMKAGSYIHSGGGSLSQWCTMGFHVYEGSGYGFAMAGHCSFSGLSDNWYMTGYPDGPSGFIGSIATGTYLYQHGGIDFMIVRLPADQRSKLIYDEARTVASQGNPFNGETVCVSPGRTDNDFNTGVDCGTVTSNQAFWLADNDMLIYGADYDSVATRVGDSGSPVYRRTSATSVTGVGIHNTAPGGFAKLADALARATSSIYR